MSKQNIEGVSYEVVRDSELKPLIHPCMVCDLKESCTTGMASCHENSIHFVKTKNPEYYAKN